MGFLDRTIRRTVRNAVGNAVEQGVRRAVEPKIEQAATRAVNSAVDSVTGGRQQTPPYQQQPYQQTPQYQQPQGNPQATQAAQTLGGLFGSFQTAAVGMANEAAKNMKVCPSCGAGATADQKFCPTCGTKLPEQTVAQGALCPNCGKQNNVGTKFCGGCGTKLPAALAQEQAAQARCEAVMAKWDQWLPYYPKWAFGGTDYSLEQDTPDEYGRPTYRLVVSGVNANALAQYKSLLRQNGFVQPRRYSVDDDLYRVINGVSYCFNSCDPFPNRPDELCVTFLIRAFDESDPAPKRGSGLRDLLGRL